MYPVSPIYKEKIQDNDRTFAVQIDIEHSAGVLSLTDKDIINNTLIYSESTQGSEEFTIGGTVASDLTIEILNRPEYEGIKFMGATVKPSIGLLISSVDDNTYFMQASQPVSFIDEDLYEYIPLGRFNIDDDNIQRNTIKLKAMDNMINFDKSYSLSKLSYPATLYQIYVNACNVADVNVGTPTFPNMNYVVQSRPEDDLTLRDMIGYVAELSGTFAKCNRNGALELKWYKPSGITIGPANRFKFIPRDDLVQIKGIMVTVNDTTYLAGMDDYAIDLSDNLLLQGGYETVLPNIFNNVKNTVFTPYESQWQGNPALQAGDAVIQIDRDGKAYNTLITNSTYKYRGSCTLSAKGLPEVAKGYKGSTNKKIANIIRKVEKEVGDKLTTLEQAQLNATELMSNMLGGHFVEDKESGIMYISNHPDITQATEYWKWGLGGFAHYKNGALDTSITADGSIVAMLVAANIVTANMVQTGVLQSEDGGTTLNLDDGSFNFRDKFILSDEFLKIKGPAIEGGSATFQSLQRAKYVFSPKTMFKMLLDNDTIMELYRSQIQWGDDGDVKAGGSLLVRDENNLSNDTIYMANLIVNTGDKFEIRNPKKTTLITGNNILFEANPSGTSAGSSRRIKFDANSEFESDLDVWGDTHVSGNLHVEGRITSDESINMNRTLDMLITDSLR